jgi:hypothetical protein
VPIDIYLSSSINVLFSGAFLIGVLVSYVLVGVLTAQTYVYYGRFPDDSPKLKALVCGQCFQTNLKCLTSDVQVAFVWYVVSTIDKYPVSVHL